MQMFVNLPVRDLDRTVAFFTALGFSFNPRFTDENATCMLVGDDGFVSYDALSTEQVKQLADAVNALSEPLSRLTAAVLA